jgi:SAM-dependent methyltransferase
MQRYPEARSQEFMQAIEAAQLSPGMVVADVPAGGGYMQRYLPKGCSWLGHEPCASFTHHGTGTRNSIPLLPLPWSDASLDAAITLAGVHHLDDKRPLFAELRRVIKPRGRLVVSDVATGSPEAQFLDGYVGANNRTGHEGAFLDESTLEALYETGWVVENSSLRNFHWIFADRVDMAAFCHELFDLHTARVADTWFAIETQLGVADLPSGQVGMNWALQTIVAVKGQEKETL